MCKPLLYLVGTLLALLVLVAAMALAQSGGGYNLSWSTIDGGGYTFSEGGSYALGGAIGQPDAGAMGNGSYILGGGFWGGRTAPYRILFMPLVLRQ